MDQIYINIMYMIVFFLVFSCLFLIILIIDFIISILFFKRIGTFKNIFLEEKTMDTIVSLLSTSVILGIVTIIITSEF